jgi:predicted ester cyclase
VNLSAPPGLPNDLEGGKMFLGAFLNAFPDGHVAVDDMIAEGDRVVTKKTLAGTHTGEFIGTHRPGTEWSSNTSTSSACGTVRSSSTG